MHRRAEPSIWSRTRFSAPVSRVMGPRPHRICDPRCRGAITPGGPARRPAAAAPYPKVMTPTATASVSGPMLERASPGLLDEIKVYVQRHRGAVEEMIRGG